MENSLKDVDTRLYLSPEKPVCRRQQLELDMKQLTGSKFGKSILLPCLFNFYAGYTILNVRLDEA